ncbi:MAG: hypothetical protein EAZ95_01935 [Bacteroidetes bacterium]|nr:MAG: hypothetical protein EAZ95_01935 [Bacteroidota bacterium]
MKAMLRATLLLIGLVCFATQTHAQKLDKKLLGKWILQSMEIDISQAIDLPENAKAEAEEANVAMRAESDKVRGKAFFEFLQNGEMNMYNEEKGSQKGTWKLEGDIIYLTKEGDADAQPFTVKFEDDMLHLRMENPEMKGMAMVLKFQK